MTVERPPAVVDVTPASADDGEPCLCLCPVRHADRKGVCEGWLGVDGVRVHFASLWSGPDGVAVCRSCIDAYPYR